MDTEDYVIRQISVFFREQAGAACCHGKGAGGEKVNILAFSIARPGVWSRPGARGPAGEGIQKNSPAGLCRLFTEVIGVRMRDEPGGLYEVARILGRQNQHRATPMPTQGRRWQC